MLDYKLALILSCCLCSSCNRYDDQFVVVAFDSAPTVDSEVYGKLEHPLRDAYESQVSCLFIMHAIDQLVIYLLITMLNSHINLSCHTHLACSVLYCIVSGSNFSF